MPTPTDYGYVAITDNKHGPETLSVSRSIEPGLDAGVFAEHVRVSILTVVTGVIVRDAGRARRSVGGAQVYVDGAGVVPVGWVSGS